MPCNSANSFPNSDELRSKLDLKCESPNIQLMYPDDI